MSRLYKVGHPAGSLTPKQRREVDRFLKWQVRQESSKFAATVRSALGLPAPTA